MCIFPNSGYFLPATPLYSSAPKEKNSIKVVCFGQSVGQVKEVVLLSLTGFAVHPPSYLFLYLFLRI